MKCAFISKKRNCCSGHSNGGFKIYLIRLDNLPERAYNIGKESKEKEDAQNGSCQNYQQRSDYNSY